MIDKEKILYSLSIYPTSRTYPIAKNRGCRTVGNKNPIYLLQCNDKTAI